MIGFAYSSIPVGFRAISISFLSFLSQKTFSGKFLRTELILSRSYARKCSAWVGPPPIINLLRVLPLSIKYAIKSESLGVRG